MTVHFLKRLALAVIVPLVAVTLAELVLRAVNFGYPTSFLVPREINGRKVYVDNQFFGYRFFPQRMTRTPAPIVLEKKKAPGVVRVFVLGESAAMGEPQANFGLSRFLEILLNDRGAGKRFEVVNAAMTAINSHVIAEIAHDCAAFQPDVFVVYMGNNEVVGPFGPGTVFGTHSSLIRLHVLATRLRLAQLLRPPREGSRWAGMEMFAANQVQADDERLDDVYNNFQANIHRIVAEARRGGAKVVLSTVAVNLRDCAPFAGEKARLAFAEGKLADARDLDELRFRADSVINDIIHKAGIWLGGDVKLVDAAQLFGEAGKDVFVDHVHFTPAGNYQLACAIADAIAPATNATPMADCLDRMIYTTWNKLDLVDDLIQRREHPPFKGQPGNDLQLADLLNQKSGLRAAVKKEDLHALRSKFETATAARPDDCRLPSQWAEILMNAEGYEESERYLHRTMELVPHRFDVRAGLALLLGYEGRAPEGIRALTDAPGQHGHFILEYLLATAKTLQRDARYPEALTFAKAALQASPSMGDARDEVATLLAYMQRWDEATRTILEGGNDPATRLKYAQLLLARRDLDAADKVLQELEATSFETGEVAHARAQWRRLAALRPPNE